MQVVVPAVPLNHQRRFALYAIIAYSEQRFFLDVNESRREGEVASDKRDYRYRARTGCVDKR